MSRGKLCSICAHKNRCQIDEWYTKTKDIRRTARKFRVSEDALGRHIRKGHLSDYIKLAVNVELKEQGLNLYKCIQEIYDIATGSAKDARDARQFGAVGSCLTAASKALDVLNKGDGGKPSDNPKDSGFSKAYLKRAKEVYVQAKDQSPPI